MTRFEQYVKKLDPGGKWGSPASPPGKPEEHHVFVNVHSSFAIDDREGASFAVVRARAINALVDIRELVDLDIRRLRRMGDDPPAEA